MHWRFAAIFTVAMTLLYPLEAAAMKGEPLEALIREAARRDVERETLREAGYVKLAPEGFFLICASGSAAEVRQAIKEGADPRQPDEERGGTTALQDAARSNPDPEVIRILIKAGADPNIQGRVYKRTALHLAVLNNPDPVPVIKALLENGADPDLYDYTPWTPLQTAINGRVDELHRRYLGPENAIILALVEGGASMNRGSGRNYTPLGHYLSEFNRHGGIASNEARLDLGVVRAMIKAGADLNAMEVASMGNTDSPLLHLAVKVDSYRDQPEDTLTRMFLEGGANPLAKAWRGKTAVHQAAFYGNPKAAALLIKSSPNGGLATTPDESGDTPLHVLARYSVPELPEFGALLLKNGADVNAADANGQTPLHYLADSAGQIERRQLETPDAAERFAARQKSAQTALSFLMENGARQQADRSGNLPVHELCDSPALPHEALLIVLRAGADINSTDQQGKTPLMRYTGAASEAMSRKLHIGYPDGVTIFRQRMAEDLIFLIRNGADPNLRDAQGMTAYEQLPPEVWEQLQLTEAAMVLRGATGSANLFEICASGCDASRIAEALSNGASFADTDGKFTHTALHDAVQRRDQETLNALLQAGCPPDLPDKFGETATGLAVRSELPGFTARLLDAGADINRRGVSIDVGEGKILRTYLSAAVWHDEGQFDLILERGPDVDAETGLIPLLDPIKGVASTGTALHVAAGGGEREKAEKLIRAGADLNAKTADHQQTPLHRAVMNDCVRVARMLLKSGADPHLADIYGRTPAWYAMSPEMKTMLKRYRAFTAPAN